MLKKFMTPITVGLLAIVAILSYVAYHFLGRSSVHVAPSNTLPINTHNPVPPETMSRFRSVIEDNIVQQYYFDDPAGQATFRKELARMLIERADAGLDSGSLSRLNKDETDLTTLLRYPVLQSLADRVLDRERLFSHQFADAFLRPANADGTISGNDTNENMRIFNRSFARVLRPHTIEEALKGRRRIQERLTDIQRVSDATPELSGISVDAATHPMLEWAIGRLAARSREIRESNRNYVIGRTDFVSIGDCQAVRELEAVWPPRTVLGNADANDEPFNVVARSTSSDLTEMRRRLQAERLVRIEGLTDLQSENTGRVYDSIERFIANEIAREDRIRRRDWSRETVSRGSNESQELRIDVAALNLSSSVVMAQESDPPALPVSMPHTLPIPSRSV